MSILAEKRDWMTGSSHLGPARVLKVDAKARRVRLHLAESPTEIWASLAIPSNPELSWGDLVLVIGEHSADWYVIGILSATKMPVSSDGRVALEKGSYAQASGEPGAETLQLFSEKQELLFEYDEENRVARVNVESGDLEFMVQRGNMRFKADRGIQFEGETVAVIGKSRIRLTADRLETSARSIVEKAKNVYRTVEQLSQLRTGRMRTLVASTFHFKARKVFVKSEQDYKIKAKQIHLG